MYSNNKQSNSDGKKSKNNNHKSPHFIGDPEEAGTNGNKIEIQIDVHHEIAKLVDELYSLMPKGHYESKSDFIGAIMKLGYDVLKSMFDEKNDINWESFRYEK